MFSRANCRFCLKKEIEKKIKKMMRVFFFKLTWQCIDLKKKNKKKKKKNVNLLCFALLIKERKF